MKNLIIQIQTSIICLLILVILVCGIYPLTVWAISQILLPEKANGSMMMVNGKLVGSSLIGQQFHDAKYFHPRPSSAGEGYDASNSGGSNLGPTSRKLMSQVAIRNLDYRRLNGLKTESPVPMDAVTSSASGLDPHISVQNALIQAIRVAKSRGLPEEKVAALVRHSVERPDLWLFGQERINVLKINLLMDEIKCD